MPQPQRVFRGLAQLLGVGFLGSIIAWQLFGALSEAAGYENVLEAELAQWTMIEQLILVVVLAPVLEETIYRLPLQSTYRPGFLALAFVIGIVFFAGPYSFFLGRDSSRLRVGCNGVQSGAESESSALVVCQPTNSDLRQHTYFWSDPHRQL